MNKILSVLAVVFLFSSLFVCLVPSASATPVYIAVNDGTKSYSNGAIISHLDPSSTAEISAEAYCFRAQYDGYITDVTVWLDKVGSPLGDISMRLEGTTTGLVPNGTVIATSESVFSTDVITDAPAAYTFHFANVTEILATQYWAIVLYISDAQYFVAGTHDIRWGFTTWSGEGNAADYYSSAWHTVGTGYDYNFIIVGDTDDPNPSTTPTPAPTSSTGDADMEALTAAILPFLVPLLVCLIPALLGYKFVGELGFFIGLNVGVVLAKVTLEGTAYAFPLWGIILVGVMDVAVVLMRR